MLGTEFMAKLTRQLKYFINKKITEDTDWQGVDIVLSGHEVPGEGEHKIMEYIRLTKAQPDYDANIRHCLYGLDADLIMLGLLSHDPHFCLLREEVTFGRQSKTKSKELEHQNFFLLHLCIVREYLELEFSDLKAPDALEFPFDLERIIDDFILMAFFVGNDFLPNLPNLHINEGALALMFKMYKSILPKAGGYINNRGVISLDRLGILLEELSHVEYRFFEAENADASWFKGKQLGKVDVMEKVQSRGSQRQITMSSAQKEIYKQIKNIVQGRTNVTTGASDSLDLSSSLNAGDRKFVQELAEDLHLGWKTMVDDEGNRHMQLSLPPPLSGDEDRDDFEDDEASLAILRVLKRYDNASILDVSASEAQEKMHQKYEEKFKKWKNTYYEQKFEWNLDNDVEMTKLTENYVQGLQWVLYYYYRGVASWPWFYGYHYSPMISGQYFSFPPAKLTVTDSRADVRRGLKADMNFQLGQPFRPFQQLMGVLPDRSRTIVPTPYHDLMTSSESPIFDFYPRDFELDMNGKKMDWEAVVKIPFIDEKRLLAAMKTREHLLSDDENARNEFGVSLKFTYAPEIQFIYPSSLPGIFPDISNCHCVENTFDLPTMEGLKYHVGLMRGVMLGDSALYGFPSLKTLPFVSALGFHGVRVFQQESRNESMVITLLQTDDRTKIESSKQLLGRSVHVGYPFLSEGKVIRVSDEMFNYSLPESGQGPAVAVPHGPTEVNLWRKKADRVESDYSKRFGIMIGDVQSIVHIDILKGLLKTDEGSTIKEYGEILGTETDFPAQIIVEEVANEDQRFIERAAMPVEEEYPMSSRAFFLGEFNYGRPLEVVGHTGNRVDIWVSTSAAKVPEFGRRLVAEADRHSPYSPSFAVAKVLGLNPLVLSKITSSFSVVVDSDRVNLGLNLKFEAKKLKVLGYSRRGPTGWEFSAKAIELVRQYMMKFPEFIAGIQRNSQGNIYNATDFYPESEAYIKVKQIQSWLKDIQSKSFEKVPLEAEQLDSEVVHKMEEAANNAFQLDPPGTGVNKKIKGAPRNAILKPSDAEHRLSHQRFALGDRVVYVQDSGRVPIATRGTVVGKTMTSRTTLLDVLFDVTFMSGTSLDDRCSPFRGSTVPLHTVLNLTDRQVIAGSRAGDSHRPRSQAQDPTTSAYGAPTGPNGAGQLKPAGSPAPLRGSFRNAASTGQQAHVQGPRNGGARGGLGYGGPPNPQQSLPIRGGPPPQRSRGGLQQHSPFRGRGSHGGTHPSSHGGGQNNLTPQGYVKLDNGASEQDFMQKNPAFRPKSYANTPPPASLDTRGDGARSSRGSRRGRGVPRARADNQKATAVLIPEN